MVMVFYGVLVFMYLQINDGAAGLCILYSTSRFIVVMYTYHYKYYTINGSKLYRDYFHNLILKFGATRTVCPITLHHYVFQ